MTLSLSSSLDFASLAAGYASGSFTPSQVVAQVLARIKAAGDDKVWIAKSDEASLLRRAVELEAVPEARRAELPLYGIPFAVKDNIDVGGMPTTAGCPDYAYTAEADAETVRRLLTAGAILVGKTNMDQFATGLVGVRSPYGVARNPFNADYIPGGSSSGSAVAVSAGLVSFSLGTDTAGSGRVPAGFNNIVGLKPTKGLVSARGVVPACRSLDCVSVFTLTVEDSMSVLEVLAGYDPGDAFSRHAPVMPPAPARGRRMGVPASGQLRFFGDDAAQQSYVQAVGRARDLGWQVVEIDFAPFAEVADLLYSGPWVAERTAAVGDFIAAHPSAALDVTRGIIMGGVQKSAVDAFRATYRLEELRAKAAAQWTLMDLMLLPTSGTIYTIDQVMADPVATNTNLGAYTNFVNLLDLCAIAIPSAMRPDGLPCGVTLMAPAFAEAMAADAASALHRQSGLPMGSTRLPPPARPMEYGRGGLARMLVVGGHLSGQPLNGQLTGLGGRLVESCRTAPVYGFYALPGTPRRPGLVRLADGAGASIEGEIWEMTPDAFGRFVATIPAPLGIGQVDLDDGRTVSGFLCEACAVQGAREISAFGGWRAFIASEGG
ncbi:Allophanate hydrolase [Paramagnetospirillum magnetotacticum MS-1]|uniref:Allophanate hydrolase n=1 Tax=Paramagnetospirillum magnetotacticum MS-1 TaxID=272627 RepID=A0A0C2YR34_PARME|nr:allophanate hydrolase [Paramagnetospirillum magnetotacticum]KIL97145.1 Allophanate hydrolase [Paramagnetospirillum magnetotacticum MS-1]